MLTKRKKQILDYIKKYIQENDYAPSLEEIKRHFRLKSVGTIHEHIKILISKGLLKKLDNQARAIEIVEKRESAKDLAEIPLVGIITAGEPIEAIEEKETITVPKSQLSKSGEHYALKVAGDSMIDEGIFDGDTVIIREQKTAENGETVVAIIDDNEATLKKLYREKDRFRLQPANPTLFPFYRKEVEVRGVIMKIIRNFDLESPKKNGEFNKKNKYGQYFTPKSIANFMISLSNIRKEDIILEPCCGKGIFLENLYKRGFRNFIAYEIDNVLIKNINPEIREKIITKSFIGTDIKEKFKLIIGNPPYIRWKNLEKNLKSELETNFLWKKYFNSLCDYLYIFILKSVELLKEGGELILITPEYWINTKHSKNLRNYLMKKGYFEKIYHFSETPIFENVASSIIIFKYIKNTKNQLPKRDIFLCKYNSAKKISDNILDALLHKKNISNVEYLKIKQFEEDKRWILANGQIVKEIKLYEKKCRKLEQKNLFYIKDYDCNYHALKDIADIGNGLVSGLDKTFQLERNSSLNQLESKNTITVLKAKNIQPYLHGETTNYIFIKDRINTEDDFKEKYSNFFNQLTKYKEKLIKRYNYNRDIKYWEWVFLRNFNLFNKKQDRIFVPCKERISNKNYFRFTYVKSGIFPTQDVTGIFLKKDVNESLFYILALLNNYRIFNWLKHKGVIKGNIVEFSEKPLNSIPIRLINWKDNKEVTLHEKITILCKQYIAKKENYLLKEINKNLDLLLN